MHLPCISQASDEDVKEERAIKFYALATLGSLAASNDANRIEIQKLDLIAMLVNITTDVKAQEIAEGQESRAGGEAPSTKCMHLTRYVSPMYLPGESGRRRGAVGRQVAPRHRRLAAGKRRRRGAY